METMLTPPVTSLTRQMVSLASLTWSPTTRTLEGFNSPCTRSHYVERQGAQHRRRHSRAPLPPSLPCVPTVAPGSGRSTPSRRKRTAARELTPAGLQDANQMGVIQTGGRVPMLEIGLAQSLGDGHELDGHLRRLAPCNQEDPTMIRTSQDRFKGNVPSMTWPNHFVQTSLMGPSHSRSSNSLAPLHLTVSPSSA